MRELFVSAQCHPERGHAAKGLCFECYLEGHPKAKRAECHPDRILWAKGLCKSCYNRQLKERNPEYAARQEANFYRWAGLNAEHLDEYRKEYNSKASTKIRSRQTGRERALAKFGLTWEDELRMLDEQSNACAICGGPSGRLGRFDLDHCHETGEFRGLICHRCNKGLGLLGDTAEAVQKALNYLTKKE